MKLYATTINEKGKKEGIGGNEYLDIDISVGNSLLAALTVRRGEIPETDAEGWVLYDSDDQPICWIEDKKGDTYCQNCVKATLGGHELRKHCIDCRKGKKKKGQNVCEYHGTENCPRCYPHIESGDKMPF